jgi:hypothetical protein
MGKFSFSQEPAVYIGLLTAIIDAIAVFFPSSLTADQKTTLVGVVTVAVPVILSFVTRSQVSPTAKPVVAAVPPAA